MDRIILSDESLNSYGFRVLSSGASLERFRKNPVMLYGHWHDDLIGRWKDIRIENGQLTAEPEFDMEDERSAALAGKFERGFLNAASIGFRILATSEAEEDMAKGQSLPTVTKWELMEASLVPVPANGNAVRLYDREGNQVNLNDEQAIQLAFSPTQKENTVKDKNSPSLEQKVLHFFADVLGIKKNEAPASEETQEEADNAGQDLAAEEVTQLNAQISELTQKLTTAESVITSLKDKHEQELTQKSNRIQELEQEVKRLSSEASDEEEDGRSDQDAKDGQGDMLPQTLQAIEYFNKLNANKK